MSNKIENKIALRFRNENLANHWQVSEARESFERLLYHLEVKTNFKPYFEEAISHLQLNSESSANKLIIADIGAGVCWTSAILARRPEVKIVYAVDPSINRLKHAKFVTRHFGVEDKVRITYGTFLEPNIPEKVDLILLCGSFHHCYDEQIDKLFINIKSLLKQGGRVLIANEHYVDWKWSLKRFLSYIKHFPNRKTILYYTLDKLRSPDPRDGEHWRTKEALEKIFQRNGFRAQFFCYKGDLCKDKSSFYARLGWIYFYAILEL